jgi:hypothetical protein
MTLYGQRPKQVRVYDKTLDHIEMVVSPKPPARATLPSQDGDHATSTARRDDQQHHAIYPPGWPRCPVCGDYALDGHITCGRASCDEQKQRRKAETLRPQNLFDFGPQDYPLPELASGSDHGQIESEQKSKIKANTIFDPLPEREKGPGCEQGEPISTPLSNPAGQEKRIVCAQSLGLKLRIQAGRLGLKPGSTEWKKYVLGTQAAARKRAQEKRNRKNRLSTKRGM